jgi:hypothetical protein
MKIAFCWTSHTTSKHLLSAHWLPNSHGFNRWIYLMPEGRRPEQLTAGRHHLCRQVIASIKHIYNLSSCFCLHNISQKQYLGSPDELKLLTEPTKRKQKFGKKQIVDIALKYHHNL